MAFIKEHKVYVKMKVRLDNNYSTNHLRKLEEELTNLSNSENTLIERVNELTAKNSALKKEITTDSRNSFNLSDGNQKDKSMYFQEITTTLKNLTRLKEEKHNLNSTAENQLIINQ